MLNWWSEKFDKMNGALRVFSCSVEWEAFDALSVCTSSKLQLLHWVPEQRAWNRKLSLVFVLPWRPCRQASPQKHAWGSRLFAKRPIMRNWIKKSLNILTFLNGFSPHYNPSRKPPGHHGCLVLITHLQDCIQQFTKTYFGIKPLAFTRACHIIYPTRVIA